MSSFLNLFLESGPGSYEVQDSLGKLSIKHYNSPRTIIARAKKTNKQYLSSELNKQLSGLESPGVSTYSPDHKKILENSPSAVFGTEKRTMSHIKALLDRSPGPVYNSISPTKNTGVTFTKARRNSNTDYSSPAPWDYNPKVQGNKLPDIVFKSTYEKNIDKFMTPGPGTYNTDLNFSTRGTYVSRVGRNFVNLRDASPGPGSYEQTGKKVMSKAKFGGDRRDLDPRFCKIYLDAKSYEIYKKY